MNIYILVIGLVAGVLGGFFGIGGGIMMIPCLVIFLGYSQKLAQGTILAAMIPPIGLLAAISYWRNGNIDIKAALLIALSFFIGGWVGGALVQNVPDAILRKAFAVVLLLTAAKMWFGK